VPEDLRRALRRYQVMSVVVGIMLLLLVGVAMPLQYIGHRPAMASVVSVLHGLLYIVYLVTAADLARRARFGIGQLVAMVCAGFLPFLAFYMEWRTTRRVHELSEAHGAAAVTRTGDSGAP
jgi:integral membrane protein